MTPQGFRPGAPPPTQGRGAPGRFRGRENPRIPKETLQWLDENMLIGFTDKRGTAWHYRTDLQGAEPNHYPGAIPVADVKRRLFDSRPDEGVPEGNGPFRRSAPDWRRR